MADPPVQHKRQLALYLQAEMARRGWSQADLAAAAKVSPRMISALIGGHYRRRPYKVKQVEIAVGWEPGTVDRILDGYRFPARDEPSPPTRATPPGGLTPIPNPHISRIRADLEAMGLPDDVIATEITRITEAKRRADADPERQEQRLQEAWDAGDDDLRATLGPYLTRLRERRRAAGCTCDRIGDDPACPRHGGEQANGDHATVI